MKSRDMSKSAIVESGSNANGEYIKWDDGTMMCWRQFTGNIMTTADGSLFRSTANPWTYPETFTSTPVVTGSIIGKANAWLVTNAGGSSADIYGMTTVSSTSNFVRSVMAIGRWK